MLRLKLEYAFFIKRPANFCITVLILKGLFMFVVFSLKCELCCSKYTTGRSGDV